MNVFDFTRMKRERRKIAMVTCYDYWSAQILNESEIDLILVGDSAAMVMHGHSSTIPATVEVLALHTAAVVRGAPTKFIVADLPFLSFRKGLAPAMDAVDALMKAGAHAVKLEGVSGHEETVLHIVQSGVPVMGHVGLTPQSVHALGGFRVQGRGMEEALRLKEEVRTLEKLGCFAVVLECVPADLAEEVTAALSIPTIGIGAGPRVDGQVLVLQDMLGMNSNFKPKFLRHYLSGKELLLDAIQRYAADVRSGEFPGPKESYGSE